MTNEPSMIKCNLTIDEVEDLHDLVSNGNFCHINFIAHTFFLSFSLVANVKKDRNVFIVFSDFSQSLDSSDLIVFLPFFSGHI